MEISDIITEDASDKIFAAHAQNGQMRVMGSTVNDGKRMMFDRKYVNNGEKYRLETQIHMYHMQSLTLFLLTCVYAHKLIPGSVKRHGDDDINFFRNLSQMIREGGTDFRYK